ncbi:MAG: alpha/beta fold hydrolase [Solirubrobacteraceae bacterium]
MLKEIKRIKAFDYLEIGEGHPIVLLHGLMGGLSNFEKSIKVLSQKYRVIVPKIPFYNLPVAESTVENISLKFLEFLQLLTDEPVILIGNSIGGHIALLTAINNPTIIKGLILTGSSGLYEKSFGDTFPKRGNYDYVKGKSSEIFYDPSTATKELVDEVYATVNDKEKAIRTLYIARSAINNNLEEYLNKIEIPVCLIWGNQDSVTPPEVAIKLNKLIKNSTLSWIDKCGHAAMMEQPDFFNTLVLKWLEETLHK